MSNRGRGYIKREIAPGSDRMETIEFLGRIDHQVKLRGFRVELGEIESVLAEHLQVPVAVGLYGDESGGNQRLIAYIGGEQDSLPPVPEIRAFLKSSLPDHMIPANFVILESLPVLPNGKIDRRALPDPEAVTDWETEVVAPRNLTEEIIATLWADVLQRERVSLHDNFFDLGGNSLLATQVVSRIREAFHITFPLRTFFDEPTVAGLAASIETIRNAGQELKTPLLVPVSREAPLRLSFAQQRLWFLQQLDPASIAYNVPMAVRFEGTLDVRALERSLEEIVRRHESLRTTFSATDEYPVQRVAPAGPFELPVVDLQAASQSDPETEARRLAAEEAVRPFNLASGPNFRTQLLRLGPEDHVLLVTLHHIVSDAWTRGLLCQEVASLYDAYVNKQPSPLPPLPIQYADFAHWQRLWLTGEVLERQLSYWRDQLADLAPLELPMDRPRPAIQTYNGAHHSVSLSLSLTQALQALSRKRGVTLAITLLAAFKVLLARYTGQTDLAIGSPIANRNRREIEGLIGFFVNTLVMRTDLSGDPSFQEVIARVREVALGAYDHQDLPFEQLVEELQPERDPSRNPLFQVMFAMQNAPAEVFTLTGVTAEPFSLETRTTHFDLECHVWEHPDRIQFDFVYNTDLFEPSTIERLGANYHRTLDAVARDPAQRLSQISSMDEAERQQLLVEWNATEMTYPREATVAERFEAQAAATPDAVAVAFGGDTSTYAELKARANGLAYHLREQGIGPEDVVGVLLPRSIDLVIGLLGIVKAGGAYLPIDPTLPSDRIAFMVTDVQASIVVTHASLTTLLPAASLKVVCLDTEAHRLATLNEANLFPTGEANNLVYIIYTSGSTGTPKGVAITHSNLLNLVSWHQQTFEVMPSDRATQVAGLSFDAAVWELWPYLLNGACVVLAPEEEVRTVPEKLRDWLVAEQITISFLPTPLAESVLSLAWPVRTPLRIMLTGGDQLHQYPASTLPFRLVNNYGPTENTVVTTSGFTEPYPPEIKVAPSIGRPIANTQVYVLDRDHAAGAGGGVWGAVYWRGGTGAQLSAAARPNGGAVCAASVQ